MLERNKATLGPEPIGAQGAQEPGRSRGALARQASIIRVTSRISGPKSETVTQSRGDGTNPIITVSVRGSVILHHPARNLVNDGLGITKLGDDLCVRQTRHRMMAPGMARKMMTGVVGCKKVIRVSIGIRSSDEKGGL